MTSFRTPGSAQRKDYLPLGGSPASRHGSSASLYRSREEIRRMPNEGLAQDEFPEPPARNPGPWQRLDLERAIAQLPEGYREIFLLHDVEGYTHEEIAQALEKGFNIPEPAFASAYRDAGKP
jgi:hypothetical protein